MKHTLSRSLLSTMVASALGVAVAMPVYAAEHDTSSKDKSAATSAQAEQRMHDQLASKLIGKEVRNAQGENLGEIKDLVVDVNNNRVHYAVLSFGGFMGMGDKLFAYPVRTLKASPDADKLVLNVDKEKLKAAPGFNKDDKSTDWTRYGKEVDRYFGDTVSVKPMPNAKLVRASTLIGKNVNNRAGKDAGEIKDLAVNMDSGKVHYVAMEFKGEGKLDGKMVALPLNAFDVARGNDAVLKIDPTRIDPALAFDKDRWPDVTKDSKYMAQMDQHFRTMSSSIAEADRSGKTTGTGGMGSTSSAGTGGGSSFQAMDRDNDGYLSRSEVRGQSLEKRFDSLDANHDGKLSPDEMK